MSTATSVGLRPSPVLTIPLVSSSLTVFYAIIEPLIFNSFLAAAKEDAPATNKVVRLWWNNFLIPGTSAVVASTLPSLVGGLYALKHLPENSLRRKLALAGAIFAAGHFAWVYPIAQTIKNVTDEEVEKKGTTMDYVRRWLKIHTWRFLTTDLPALLCFGYVAFGEE